VKRVFITLGLIAALAASIACKKTSAPEPDVWAVVNGKEIRRDEVEKYFRNQVNPEGQALSQEESLTLMLNILDQLINNEILLARAQKLALEASDGEVEDKFTERKAPFTEEEFQRQLKENNLTVDDVKRDLRRQLSIEKLLNREVMSKISITDQDVTDFYNQNRAEFNFVEAQYRVAQILITAQRNQQIRNRKNDDATTDAEARRKAQTLFDRLREGADFGELAMDYSEDPLTASTGGDLGFIPESGLQQADAALRRAVLSLRPGEFSNVVASPDGYRILRLIGREPAGQRQLTDPRVQQAIRDRLRTRKQQLLHNSYLTVARDEAEIDNYLSRQVLESAGKMPEIKHQPPAKSEPASAPAKQ